MSLARELSLHPEYFEDAVRAQVKRFAQKPHGGWTQFFHRVYRPGIGHDMHVAGKSNEELRDLLVIAKRIFNEECPSSSVTHKKDDGLPENLYTKKE
jgi:hypothetical protein